MLSLNSLFFIGIFLPAVLLFYFLLPERFRNIVLVAASLIFYAWGEVPYLIVMLFSVGFNYIAGLQIQKAADDDDSRTLKILTITTVAANLAVLGFYKYFGFLITNINAIFRTRLSVPNLPLPVGISFFTFSVLSYVLDVRMGRAKAEKNLLHFILYVTFFPKLISGPIVQYNRIKDQLAARKVTKVKVGMGLDLFLMGLMKKILIADNLGTAFQDILHMTDRSVLTAWLGMIFFSLQLYFDFGGYSDMAIGLAKFFGFHFDKNFDYPYMSHSISEFWRRWHISLGAWFRDYIYIPMGGNRCTVRRQALNLAVVWLLTGLWHGASWTFIFWGLWHGALVMLEHFVLKGKMEKVPSALRILITDVLAGIGWVFFFSPSLKGAFVYIGQLFGAGGAAADKAGLFYLKGNLVLLAASILLCTPIVYNVFHNIFFTKGKVRAGVGLAIYLVLFGLCIAGIVGSTYQSFLYAAF